MKIKLLCGILLMLVISGTALYYLNTNNCEICSHPKNRTGIIYDFIADYKNKRMISSSGEIFLRTWKDDTNVYDVFIDARARVIYSKPEIYLKDAISIITSNAFDQTQKLYVIILMQHLSIKKYICFMRAVNQAYEKNIIDKEVAVRAIWPDVNLKGTSLYYWWLPAWRDEFRKYGKELENKHEQRKVLSGWLFWNAI